MKIKRGSTSVRRVIFIADSSVSTGVGLANLVYNTLGLVAYYFAGDLSNEVQITLATATLGTFTSGGFIAVDNTNMPGWYEIGIPDAALDGGNEVCIQLRGAANMVPVNLYIQLDAFDYQTATQPVNVTQYGGANGTFSAGRPEVNATHWGGTAVASASVRSNLISILGTAITETVAGYLSAAFKKFFDVATPVHTMASVDQTGDSFARIGATGSGLTSITNKTVNLPSDPASASTVAASFTTVNTTLATLATAANQTKTLDRLGYLMAQEIGACADAGTSAESYTLTIDTTTYTIDHTGLDATGNRGTATLTKS